MSDPYQQQAQRMIDRLKTEAPEMWHSVARSINFQFGVAVWRWIIEQPECDRATPQFIFMLNDGAWCQGDDLPEELSELFSIIVQRWNAQQYTRSKIASYDLLERPLVRVSAAG